MKPDSVPSDIGWRLPKGVSRQVWDRAADPEAVLCDERAAQDLDNADIAWVVGQLSPSDRLIDLGCGGGRLMEKAAPACSMVAGVDVSWPGLKRAHERMIAIKQPSCLVRADLADLGTILTGTFDVAACLFSTMGMISPFSSRQAFLGHVRRILKPGGRFLVHAHNRWWHLGTPAGRHWLLRDSWMRFRSAPDAGAFRHPDVPAHAPALAHYGRRELARLLGAHGFLNISVKPVNSSAGKSWLTYGWHATATAPE
jgi:SAM-dependent methyltransferase